MKNFKKAFWIGILITLSGCSKSFDDLTPQEATRAVGYCVGYYIAHKGGIDSQMQKLKKLTLQPNVSSRWQKMSESWTVMYFMRDKEEAIRQAHEACDLAGIPR